MTCFKDGNRERTDIHEAVKPELVKMAYAAGCRKISVEPRASDTGNDRADIEIRDFCNDGRLVWLDISRVG